MNCVVYLYTPGGEETAAGDPTKVTASTGRGRYSTQVMITTRGKCLRDTGKNLEKKGERDSGTEQTGRKTMTAT